MRQLKQSAARTILIWMADSTDHITGKASLTLTITASKNGGAFSAITPTVTDLAGGWYSLALTSGHTDTVGDLCLHITSAGADPSDISMEIIAKLVTDLHDLASGDKMDLVDSPNPTAVGVIQGGLATNAYLADFLGSLVVGLGLIQVTINAVDSLTQFTITSQNEMTDFTGYMVVMQANTPNNNQGAVRKILTGVLDHFDSGSGLYYHVVTVKPLPALPEVGDVMWLSALALAAQPGDSMVASNMVAAPDNADIVTIKNAVEDGVFGLAALAALIGNISISGVWNALLSGMSTTGSIGKKLADWVLGTDNKVLLSSDAQTGVTIPTVTSVSNPVTVSPLQVVSGVIQNRFNVVLDETLGPFKRGDTIPSGAITFNFGSDYAALSDDKMYFCVKLDPTGTKLVDLQCTYTDRANCAGYVPLIDLEAAGIDPVDQYYEFSQMNAAGTAKVTPAQGIFAVEQDVRQLT